MNDINEKGEECRDELALTVWNIVRGNEWDSDELKGYDLKQLYHYEGDDEYRCKATNIFTVVMENYLRPVYDNLYMVVPHEVKGVLFDMIGFQPLEFEFQPWTFISWALHPRAYDLMEDYDIENDYDYVDDYEEDDYTDYGEDNYSDYYHTDFEGDY